MKRPCWILALCLAAAVSGESGWAAEPRGVGGTWAGDVDQKGTLMTLELRSEGGTVTGNGHQARGALQAVTFRVSGTWRPPRLLLTLHLADGMAPVLDALQTEPEKLAGTLTWPGGTVQSLTFVRP
jgi:hypothetical protein